MTADFLHDSLEKLESSRTLGTVSLIATADLPSRFGEFKIAAFLEKATGKEHSAIFRGDLDQALDVPCRIHSECHTGDVLGSLRCDCRSQLEKALTYIGTQPAGIVLYLRQEGRGIGLGNKIKAYRLQEAGLDTVEANEALGFPAEARGYAIAADMLRLLGVGSIKLLSNNPHKFEGLKKEGIKVTGRMPIIIEANRHNRRYLETKALKMGHELNGSTRVINFKPKTQS
jgi:GTP cyclohydrolase II